MVADPVDVATGNYHSNVTDLAVARKAPISFERYYNAQDYKERGYGLHWRHKYDMYVEKYDDYTKVYLENGSVESFHHESGQLKFNPSKYNNVSYNSAGEFVLEFKNHQTYTFHHKKGNTFIKTIEDKGNLTHFHITPFFDSVKHEDSVRLVKVSSVSGEINIKYTPDYHYITDGSGRKVRYGYNGRYLISTTNVSANSYQYDPRGLLIGKVDEDKVETQFSYDLNRNLIETKIINQPLAGAEGSTINYAYDALGRLTKRLDSLYSVYHGGSESPKTYTYSYDIVGRLLSETDFEGKVTSFAYDLNSNITKMTYPDTSIVSYTHDNRNRIETVTDKDGTNRYTYDKNGRRLRLDFANGTHEKYAYDKKGRTLSQVTGDKTNTTMTIHDYEYDKNDNIVVDVFKNFKTSLIKDVIVKTYAYDALNQLTIDKERQDCYEGYGTQNNYYYDSMGN